MTDSVRVGCRRSPTRGCRATGRQICGRFRGIPGRSPGHRGHQPSRPRSPGWRWPPGEALIALQGRTGQVFTVETGQVSPDDVGDDETPYRTVMRQMMGAFGHSEKTMIRRRLKAGRQAKAGKGEYAYGMPPFGGKAIDRELALVESEQATIACIRELRKGGASLRSIAATLTEEGHRPRRGDRCHPESLKQIIPRF